jgi:hypothetical protein
MTREERLKKASKLTGEIDWDIMQLAELIENADSWSEADKIFKDIEGILPIGKALASDIWDYMVDWDKVKWKEKEKEVV